MKTRPMYTNELTPELIARFKNPHTPEELAAMDENTQAFWKAEAEKMAPRTLEAIWRLASEGSLTRDGGCIEKGSSEFVHHTDSGEALRIAQVGDEVVYPDGSRATIISGSGDAETGHCQSFALVGSALDNGDEIICTPQPAIVRCLWDNSEPLPANFLKIASPAVTE